MANIQPKSLWVGGQEKTASVLNLRSISDDLATTATFYWELQEADVVVDEQTTQGQVLQNGNLAMSGEDYQLWNGALDINAEAYSWAAVQLNLILV